MQPGLSIEERIHKVKMGMTDVINTNGWRQAVRQRFNFVPRYGRLVVEALLEIWPDDFRERVLTEARFRDISGDPDLLYDVLEDMLPIQSAREKERRILRYGRMWSGGSGGGLYHDCGNGGHGGPTDGTGDGFTGSIGSDRGRNQNGVPGSGNGGSSSWRGSGGGSGSGVFNHGGGNGVHGTDGAGGVSRGFNHGRGGSGCGRSWLRCTPGSGHEGSGSWRGSGGGLGGNRGSNHSGIPGNGNGGSWSCHGRSWSWRSQGDGGRGAPLVGGSGIQGGGGHGDGGSSQGNGGNGGGGGPLVGGSGSRGGGGHGDGGSSHGNGGDGRGGNPIVGGNGSRGGGDGGPFVGGSGSQGGRGHGDGGSGQGNGGNGGGGGPIVGGSGSRGGAGHGDGGSGQDNGGGNHGGASDNSGTGVLVGQRPAMVPPVPGTGQLYAPAATDGSAGGGPNGRGVATRTRSRNGTGPAGQHAVLLDAGAEGVGGQGDSYAPTSSGAQAEAPREQNKVGSMGVPPGPDPRVVRFELPEAPAREGAGGTQGAGDAVQGGADMPHGSAPGYTTSARVRGVESEGSGLTRVKTNAAHESMAAQRYPVPNSVPARLRVKSYWG